MSSTYASSSSSAAGSYGGWSFKGGEFFFVFDVCGPAVEAAAAEEWDVEVDPGDLTSASLLLACLFALMGLGGVFGR
ncbi:hypothetical protein Slin15195_G072430 [Septoria linicola]|uniref:Uncharacterized protein n=1 Tax=Septoria linicola TaxID=215465 RepID=A0A9Q9EL38_9PEZI|nr:hypothetical protein Slin14017_G105170 [Septoria linicola]USW53924.1 hypothetical protein Slin15195_G072430 [Septoria linicola]